MFPQRSGDDDPEVVTIIGRKEKVEAAKNHLEKLIKDLVREREREREWEWEGWKVNKCQTGKRKRL